MLFLGCDVHRNYTTISCVDEGGNVLGTDNIPNSLQDLRSLLDRYPGVNFSTLFYLLQKC